VEGKMLREVTIIIGLERLDMQEGITVEALLNSGATGLVMSLEFAGKKGFKLKKIGETDAGKKCGWVFQQRRTNRKYCGSKCVL